MGAGPGEDGAARGGARGQGAGKGPGEDGAAVLDVAGLAARREEAAEQPVKRLREKGRAAGSAPERGRQGSRFRA